jgi:hypothetical protein
MDKIIKKIDLLSIYNKEVAYRYKTVQANIGLSCKFGIISLNLSKDQLI